MNSVFLVNKYKRCFFHFFIFGCWLLPEKFSFCPKNDDVAQVRGAAAPLARTPMLLSHSLPLLLLLLLLLMLLLMNS